MFQMNKHVLIRLRKPKLIQVTYKEDGPFWASPKWRVEVMQGCCFILELPEISEIGLILLNELHYLCMWGVLLLPKLHYAHTVL